MQGEIEKAWLKAQIVISRSRYSKDIPIGNFCKKEKSWKSLNEKLSELYSEELNNNSKYECFRSSSHLLKKLVVKEKLNRLILNFYPGNEGYSLMIKNANDTSVETMRLPYEESDLLQYIDNRELPPIIIDLLEEMGMNFFYCGCLIVEMRDYRRSSNYDSDYVLLKPSTQTIISDLNVITSDSQRWSYEDKQQLESSMLLATQEPLCLDPSVAVTFVANQIQHEANFVNQPTIKKNVQKYSQVFMNKRKKFNHLPAPANLKLHDFIKRRNIKLKIKKSSKPPVDTWKPRPILLQPPPLPLNIPSSTRTENLNNSSEVSHEIVEEYILEAERKEGKIYYTKITVLKRSLDEAFIGKLYVDRDYIDGKTNGATCQFTLGSRIQVDKYINQFKEIFTEEGRKAVKITHKVPGHPMKVSFTPGMKDKVHSDNDGSDQNKSALLSKDQSIANSSGLVILSNGSNLDNSKNLFGSKLVSAQKPLNRQMSSPIAVSQLKVETTKAISTGLPSYSQALSGAVKPVRPNNLKKTDLTSPDTVTMTSPVEKSQLNALASGEILVNHATPVSCQNINSNLNIASFPQNISVQNLGRVSHLQVSLTAMPQTLTVPISIAMVDPSQSVIVTSSAGSNIITGASVTSASNVVKPSLTIPTSSSFAQNVMVSSALVSTQSSVLSTPANVLSLPVNVANNLNSQNLTQLMATGLKSTGANFRATPGGGLSLLQVSGSQQPISIFNPVSSSVINSGTKSAVSGISTIGNLSEVTNTQQPILTLNPQQQQLQLALQKQQLQQLQQQLQFQQSGSNKGKPQKRTLIKPQK